MWIRLRTHCLSRSVNGQFRYLIKMQINIGSSFPSVLTTCQVIQQIKTLPSETDGSFPSLTQNPSSQLNCAKLSFSYVARSKEYKQSPIRSPFQPYLGKVVPVQPSYESLSFLSPATDECRRETGMLRSFCISKGTKSHCRKSCKTCFLQTYASKGETGYCILVCSK